MYYLPILVAMLSFLLGMVAFPFLVFLRARRSSEWDTSNLFNIFRVIAHLAIRPSDFGKMQYADGRKPFWYIGKDEFSEVVKTNSKED